MFPGTNRRYLHIVLMSILLTVLSFNWAYAGWRTFGGNAGGEPNGLKVWGYDVLKICRDGFIAVASTTTNTGQLDIYGYDSNTNDELTPRFEFIPANHSQTTPFLVERFTTPGEFNTHNFYAYTLRQYTTPFTGDANTDIRFHSITPLNDTETLGFVPVENCQIADATPNHYALLNVHGENGETALSFPSDVALDPSGNVYLTLDTDQKVIKYDPAGTFIQEYPLPSVPSGIAINDLGIIYIITNSGTKVTRYDANMNQLGQFGSGVVADGNFGTARSITIDSANNVYVTDNAQTRVEKFDSSGNFLIEFGKTGGGNTQLYSPRGIAVDSNNNIYVVDSNLVKVYNDQGVFQTAWGTTGSNPGEFEAAQDIAIDSEDSVFVTDNNRDRVMKFTTTGQFLHEWDAPSDLFSYRLGAYSVAANDSGNVYVVQRDTGDTTQESNHLYIYRDVTRPVASNDSHQASFNVPFIALAPGILTNDTPGVLTNVAGLNRHALTAQLVDNPTGGTVQLNADGSFVYTANTGFVGTDTFTYRATDGKSTSFKATVTITIPNPTPQAVNDTYSTNMNTQLTVSAGNGVLANDTDANHDTLTAVKVTNPASGNLQFNSNGSFTFTPSTGFTGQASFTYYATDGTSNSNNALVTINVIDPNAPSPSPTTSPSPSTTPSSNLVLSSPRDTITTSIGNPVYTWVEVEGATSYTFYLAPTSNLLDTRFYDTLQAAEYCQNNICAVDLTEIAPSAWLPNDEYILYMHASNAYDLDWPGYQFEILSPTPATITPGETTNTVGTSNPTLNWTLEGNAVFSAFYQLYIAPTDNILKPALFGWVSRRDACGSWDSITCALQLPVNLQDKTHYTAYIQSWGPGGFSTGGVANTGWGGPITFNMGGPIPNVPSGIQVNNANPPTITWSDDPLATSFIIWVGDIDQPNTWPGSVSPISKTGSGISCDGATCSYTVPDVLMPGSYSIYMQAQGENGHSRGGLGGAADGWVEGPDFVVP